MKIYKFTRPDEHTQTQSGSHNSTGIRLISFPASAITSIEAHEDTQGVFLKVNGIEVRGSYKKFINQLEEEEEDDDG